MSIAAIVLAAGSARRFGSDKRRHAIDGVPMLARTLRTYRRVLETVACVVRPGEAEVADLVRTASCQVVEAPDAALGQSRSLAAGVAALTAGPATATDPSPRVDGLIIGLADMPFVAEDTLRRLLEAMSEHPDAIVRPRCRGRAGNPVGFPKRLFEELQQLVGDTGARELVTSSDSVVYLDVDDEGVLVDIDRPPTRRGDPCGRPP